MPRAGYCAGCGEHVWLTPEGGCPKGHGSEQISGVYETAPQAAAVAVAPTAPPAEQPKRKSKAWIWIVLGVVLVLLLCCCGAGAALVIPAFNSAKTDAEAKTCFANQRQIDGAAQTYAASTNEKFPSTIDALVPEYLKSVPECPSGGTYKWDAAHGTVSCSIHGRY